MPDIRREVADLVEDDPSFDAKFRHLLEVDSEIDGWEFNDISLDAGTFGEIVSRGIAKETDSGYRLTDPTAVRDALDGETSVTDDTSADEPRLALLSLTEFISRDWVLILTVALLFVAIVRISFVWDSVFRNGDVVLVSNDPYFYRYHVDHLVTSKLSPFSITDLAGLNTGGTVLANHDILFVVTMWIGAALLGGTKTASGLVLAWYPVVAGVVTAGAVYLIATRVTSDRRVGIVAVLLLATIPAHAYRTMLGMGDHHAFDYVWLSLTIVGLVRLVTLSTDAAITDREYWNRTNWWGAVLLTGVSLTGQLFAWRAGPLLIVPFALFVVTAMVSAVRRQADPLAIQLPLAVAVSITTILTLVGYFALDWLPAFRAVVPILLLGGVAVTTGVGKIALEWNRSPVETGVASLIAGIVLLAAAWVLIPNVADALLRFADYQHAQATGNVVDSMSLLSPGRGLFLNPLLEIGFVFYISLPVAIWLSWVGYRDGRQEWTSLGVYFLYFLLLSLNQIRFVAQLSLFVAVFGAIGFFELADRVELLEAPDVLATGKRLTPNTVTLPSASTFAYLFVLFVLISSVGAIQTPIKQSQLPISDQRYETATWMEQYDDEHSWTYPNNYVFSNWGRNRIYNYFVSGHSRSYHFSNVYYQSFISSRDSDYWYGYLRHQNVRFVVTRDVSANFPRESMQVRLHERWGASNRSAKDLGHFRGVYATDDGAIKVFTIVPAATIQWTSSSNETVRVARKSNVSVSGETFPYHRVVAPNERGIYVVSLPYPGTYTIRNTTIRVNETMVQEGMKQKIEINSKR